MTRRYCYRVLSSVLIVGLLVVAMGLSGAAAQSATVESGDVSISNVGDTGQSAITIDADNGVSIARLNVSVDTNVAEITNVQEGADVDSSQNAQTFNVVDQTSDSVRVEYNNIAAQASPVQDFELAVVDLTAQSENQATISLRVDALRDGNTQPYPNQNVDEGTVDVGVCDTTFGGLGDCTDEGDNRVVGGPGGNSATVFLGENDIALDAGVFRDTPGGTPVQPGDFTDPDGATLSVTNGVIDQNNAITTYTLDPGDIDGTLNQGRTIDVREARIQDAFIIDALSNERLDGAGTPVVEQTPPGDNFNVQIAANYNYFDSTGIALNDSLIRNGSGVTSVFLEDSLDASRDPGAPFTSVDEDQRTYDFLANFDVDETGEYTANFAPATGDNRTDGRDVGFDSREDASDTEDFEIVEDVLFAEPLPGFNNPPTNTEQLDTNLYEDVSGDGDGLDPSQTVTLWTELVLNPDAFNDLTQEQVDALDWNGDGQLSPADAVSLWTEQVLN